MSEYVTWGNKQYKVLQKPSRHIRINALDNKPTISARWNLKKDNPPKACTCDMIHLAPYKGCTIDCSFCSLPRYRGFGVLKSKHDVSVVFDKYDEYVDSWIKKCHFLHTFDFGADADVFMDINRRYHMTEKTMSVLNKWGVPFTVTTKGHYTDWAIDELSQNPNSWAQISVVTADEAIRKQLIPGEEGATIDQIGADVEALKFSGVHVTARVQPYIYGLSEPPKKLIKMIKNMGFDSVVFGLMRAPMGAGKKLLEKYSELSGYGLVDLYSEKTPGYWQIPDETALKILTDVKKACDHYGLEIGICDVYTKGQNGKYKSMQKQFGSCTSCETVNSYGYCRGQNDDKFKQVENCIGNCMYCKSSPCGNHQFYSSVQYQIKDYAKLGCEK